MALCSHEAVGLGGTKGDLGKVIQRVDSPLREEETTGSSQACELPSLH
jgi:hypothetical protein